MPGTLHIVRFVERLPVNAEAFFVPQAAATLLAFYSQLVALGAARLLVALVGPPVLESPLASIALVPLATFRLGDGGAAGDLASMDFQWLGLSRPSSVRVLVRYSRPRRAGDLNGFAHNLLSHCIWYVRGFES